MAEHAIRGRHLAIIVVAIVLGVASTVPATTPGQRCQQRKNKEAGKYAYCRQKVEAKFALAGDTFARTASLQRCLDKYESKWTLFESRALSEGGACPSVGDQGPIQDAIDVHTTNIATALAGGLLGNCPSQLATCQDDLGTCEDGLTTCQDDLSSCQTDLSTCTSDLGATQTDLASCQSDLGDCEDALGTCQTDLGTCQDDLGTCQTDLATALAAPHGHTLQTGQTDCWNASGTLVPCAGTGHDGDVQAGLARLYTDNGNGTITDERTGLTWEKLSDDGSIHDINNMYNWSGALAKVATLNSTVFAGHTDWRLPNLLELQALVHQSYTYPGPAVSPEFNTGCVPGCSVTTGSCTAADYYWSSTSVGHNPGSAWQVRFVFGDTTEGAKGTSVNHYARAVRGS